MTIRSIALASAAFLIPAAAAAQAGWVPGSEIVGPAVQGQTAGVTTTVYFDAGGAARIVTPAGNTVPASWTAANGQLCLQSGAASECWPYQSPFQAGQQMTLTSSCQATSTWLANSVNTPPPPPQSQPAGERG